MITHNQIKQLFSDIATNHNMIKSFGIGDTWEAGASVELEYLCMWVEIKPAVIDNNEVTMNYTLWFFDEVDKGEGNEDEVLSDTQRVAMDVIAILQSNNYKSYFKINKTINLTHFTEKLDDEVSGWSADISIRQLFEGDSCQVAITEIPTII